ncbi:MAG: phage holin family protein [Planctomycetaceae bacterium]|nr:phage holin family protein [Planctomycetaceae bacterium]
MVDQEKVTNRLQSTPTVEPPRDAEGVDGLLHRLVLLAELQAELFWSDVRSGLRRLLLTGILLGGTIAAGIAGVFLLMVFIAELLVGAAGLHRSTAFFWAVIIDLVITLGLAIGAVVCLRASVHVFRRSRDEWRRTLHWVKDAFSRTSSPSRDGRK